MDFGCGTGVLNIKNDLLDVSVSDNGVTFLRMEICSLLLRIAACFARSLKLANGVLCLVFALLTPFGVFGIVDCCCLKPDHEPKETEHSQHLFKNSPEAGPT